MSTSNEKEYIAYEGPEFTIEWYFTEDGQLPALEYFNSLDKSKQVETFRLFETMAKIGKIWNITKFRNEGDNIWAFKPKPHRFLCFFVAGKKIIVTHGFAKKQDDLPQNEKEKALKYKRDYQNRVKLGKYYD